MNNSNDLFPFPGQNSEDREEETIIKPDLPDFPQTKSDEDKLSSEEIRQVRKLLKKFADQPEAESTKKDKPQDLPTFPAAPARLDIVPSKPGFAWQETISDQIAKTDTSEVWEAETAAALGEILQTIQDEKQLIKVFSAVCGVFPVKKCLRHGTPDQKLFALIALGDRFLQLLSGIAFAERKKLLKTVAAYLSKVAEQYNFIQMENETFSPQYHERARGSSTTGRLIREMQGFLVVARDNNKVVRTAVVLT
jgi:hypothetical protein